ncbi:MAG: hypothetical protein KDD82_01635 [Planctomycetes bacterium]|nr:hypothetical protein [Planctomycetota bacterium]
MTKIVFLCCLGLAAATMLVAAPAGWGVPNVRPEPVKQERSVRPGTRRTTFVFLGYGGK